MSNRIAVFVDIPSLYYCCGKRFPDHKVDYEKYLARAKEFGELFRAIAYGTQKDNEAQGFITCLRHAGFEVKYNSPANDNQPLKRLSWNVGIAMDVVRTFSRVDTVILGVSSPDMVPLVEYVIEHGLKCIILACGINKALKQVASSFIELNEDILHTV